MFTVYARYINPIPGRTMDPDPDAETELFSIPNQNGSRVFLNTSINTDMGSAGSFEFSVDPKSVYADIWKHMKTLVRVVYDGDTIFYGRVLTIDRDMFRTRKIHCEGAYTFFMDSVFLGKKGGYALNLDEYITKLIDAHNTCMTDAPEKKIYRGEVPGNYSEGITDVQKVTTDRQKFADGDGYKDVKSFLEELKSDYGGFMRVRYNEDDGKLYLDWMKMYFNSDESNQTMSVSSNVIDLSDTVEVNNIFTHVIPVGKNNKYIGGSSSSGGGGGYTGKYTITFQIYPSGAGTARADQSTADEGKTVHVFATPNTGYKFSSWVVRSTKPVTIDRNTNTFTMPDNNVTIDVLFTQDESGMDIDGQG